MALGIRQFIKGLRLVPESATSIDTLGELQVNSTDNKLAFHNGTSASYLLTESGSATGTNRLTNKELDDSSVLFVDNGDTSKKLAFQLSGLTTATTRTLTIADASGTIIISGGQPAAATLEIGTNSAQAVALRSNSTVRLTAESGGAITINSGTLQGASGADLDVTAQSGQALNLGASGSLVVAKKPLSLENVLRGTTLNDGASTGADATLGLPARAIVRVTNGSLASIAGIGAGATGQHLILSNDTGASVTVKNEAAGATAADRITTGTGANLTMSDGASLWLIYEDNLTRWRVIGGSGGGSTLTAPVSKTANYTILSADETILADSSGGAFTLTLPASAALAGKKFIIKKTDASANGVILDGNSSETIDGQLTYTLASTNESITVQSDGSNWVII